MLWQSNNKVVVVVVVAVAVAVGGGGGGGGGGWWLLMSLLPTPSISILGLQPYEELWQSSVAAMEYSPSCSKA